jgi:type II secretory pathway pseudopilin PulG
MRHAIPNESLEATTGRNSGHRLRGLTLVELLVVMGLLILLTSLSLNTLKGLLRSQKVTQAATLVKQYFENAQIRAVTNGRPVAVFLDRLSVDTVPGSLTVTRLQFGEVFPPYVGDEEGAVGRLVDTSMPPDGYADELVFDSVVGSPNERVKVISGFGFFDGNTFVPGFIRPGDLIEIEGTTAIFDIGDYIGRTNAEASGQIVVPLNNFGIATQLPIRSGLSALRKFKVYRQPTKSMVGTVTLPRGTCIDLSLSGIGPVDNSVVAGTFFPPPAAGGPGNFSRVGIVFDAQGRASYMLQEVMINGQLTPSAPSTIIANVYLMIGRTDQVLPGFPGTVPDSVTAALQQPGTELPQSNLLDPENVWISCNPFTGEIKSSPVAGVDQPADLIESVRQARQLAVAGLSN